jgi:ketosteroid isomerase-like protein
MRLAALLGAVLLAASTAVAQPASSPTPSQTVATVVQRFTHAQFSFDLPALKELIADDYVEVSPVGDVDPRDKMLGFYAPENRIDGPALTVDDVQVRIYGATAVAIARLSYAMNGSDGKPHPVQMRGMFVARTTPSGWRLVSTAFTPMSTAKPQQ